MVRSCAKDNAGSPSSSICVRKAGRQKETWCLSAVLPQLCVSALRRSALFPLSLSRLHALLSLHSPPGLWQRAGPLTQSPALVRVHAVRVYRITVGTSARLHIAPHWLKSNFISSLSDHLLPPTYLSHSHHFFHFTKFLSAFSPKCSTSFSFCGFILSPFCSHVFLQSSWY